MSAKEIIREHVQTVLRVVNKTSEHPLVLTRRVFNEAGIHGYAVASARMSETFDGLLVVVLSGDVERGKMKAADVRWYYEAIIRDAFLAVPDVSFVRLDHIREVPGRSLARDVAKIIDEASADLKVSRVMKGGS